MDLTDGVYDDSETVLPDAAIEMLDAYHKLLINSPKIMIAAVNGPGIGYGTSSIALFDLVYAVPETYFFTPFVKWGLCAEACSSFTFASILGRQKASALILADERMTLMTEVLNVAERIAKLPAESLQVNKALMMAPFRKQLLKANEVEITTLRKRARNHEAKNAIKTFAEGQYRKRKVKLRSML
ncbi:uncharacterized protein Z518_09293 [Rhinocladiella mackenziei CBS 650.93]|uniref:Enoyl-CoA hydratase n=1 Tax=Rhinocladiella mackenziei CBS 650.93 TaxID=1442369 RepID=A0A0D2FHX2_9EURO|nr:uncharacterized protein Z518_09293 [Rhinocladiella mackenziei CBS 650.93]KIX01567.1 hypothetical protein Z518_09293 [Rhinocladiella mackenziei CBS 650.93]